MSGPVAEATAKTPYLVARRLRSLTAKEVRTQERFSMAWISQAAELITAMAEDRRRLTMLVNNYARPRCKVVRIEAAGVKQSSVKAAEPNPRAGKAVALASPAVMAVKIADLIQAPVDLYRSKSGGVRVVTAGVEMKGVEFLGRFDEGATIQDIKEAIE